MFRYFIIALTVIIGVRVQAQVNVCTDSIVVYYEPVGLTYYYSHDDMYNYKYDSGTRCAYVYPRQGVKYEGKIVVPDRIYWYSGLGQSGELCSSEFVDFFNKTYSNTDIEHLVINNGETSWFGEQFAGCDKLHTVEVGPGVAVSFHDNVFKDCAVKNFITNGASSRITFADHSFSGCKNSVLDLRGANARLSGYAFIDCPSDMTLILDENNQVWPLAFVGANFKTLHFTGNSGMYFDHNSLAGAVNLTEIIIESSTPPSITEDFDKEYEIYPDANLREKCTLRVPESALPAYRAANIWKDFKTILPIENSVGSVDADRTVISTQIYDLLGRPVDPDTAKGVVLICRRYSDGTYDTQRQVR